MPSGSPRHQPAIEISVSQRRSNVADAISVRRGRAFPQVGRGNLLRKGHVLPAQLHVQRARDFMWTKLPSSCAGRSMHRLTNQDIRNRLVLPALMVQLASLERRVLQNGKCGTELLMDETSRFLGRRISEIRFKVRHPGIGRHLIESCRENFRWLSW